MLAEVDRYAPPEPDARSGRQRGSTRCAQRSSSAECVRRGARARRDRGAAPSRIRAPGSPDGRIPAATVYAVPPPEEEIDRYYREHRRSVHARWRPDSARRRRPRSCRRWPPRAGRRWSANGSPACGDARTSGAAQTIGIGNRAIGSLIQTQSRTRSLDYATGRPSRDEELAELQQIEAGVADDRGDDRAPAQVDDRPERAEQRRGDRRRRRPG